VYSVPSVTRFPWSKLDRKLRRLLQLCGLPVPLLSRRRPTAADLASWPVRSPYENTRHLYQALSARCPTDLYHLTERVRCRFSANDVFLGHPHFPHRDGARGVTELALTAHPRPRKVALITPLHCDVEVARGHIDRDFLDDVDRLLPAADVLFAIMGEYWWDRWDDSPYSHWKSKMVRLDMAVDCARYPRVKQRFNAPGKRGFLYIGESHLRKGTDFLGRLMERFPNCPRAWLGHGPPIPNMRQLAAGRALDPEFMRELARDYDFFISPSRADPNPTTILESMAWGFPVACTPQSGYYATEYRQNLVLDDLEHSSAVLARLQSAPEAELLHMADLARSRVEQDYTWQRFTDTVLEHLDLGVS
jgi:glycosyltransferase involved in cell wall biosynthesis